MDISDFGIVLVIFLFSSGSAVYLMNMNRMPQVSMVASEEELETAMVQPTTKGMLANSISFQYLLMLGAAETNSFGKYEVWFDSIVLYSTFMTQILILNMLIAIMSDTFERHQ